MSKKLAMLCAITVMALLTACGATTTTTIAPTQAPAAQPTKAAAVATTAPAATTSQGTGLIKGAFEGEAKALNGAGATFPAALYSKWFNEYAKLTGVQVNYQSIGSGGGIKSIQDATVDFGATDGFMSDEQLSAAKNGAVLHIPMALGAVVPTYNVPEAKSSLKFTGETIAGIFLGTITKWNDAKLVADNPELANVNQEIVVVHRSDGSGTSFIFTDYLSSVSDTWKTRVGRGTAVNWPVGLGGKGNEGVAGEVKQNQYALGYVELIYALQNKLGVGDVKNKAGKFVTPSLESVTAAAASVAETIPADLRASIVNANGEKVYPISGFTWLLVYQKQNDKAKAVAVTRLMWWAIYDAQQFNANLGYAPLPESVVKKAAAKIQSITLADGSPAFPGK